MGGMAVGQYFQLHQAGYLNRVRVELGCALLQVLLERKALGSEEQRIG